MMPSEASQQRARALLEVAMHVDGCRCIQCGLVHTVAMAFDQVYDEAVKDCTVTVERMQVNGRTARDLGRAVRELRRLKLPLYRVRSKCWSCGGQVEHRTLANNSEAVEHSEPVCEKFKEVAARPSIKVTCGGCLVGLPRGTGMHSYEDGCALRQSV